jgi:type VI secretion system secreted protein VgrG
MQKVAGAIVTSVDGDRSDEAGASYTEIAAGAHIIKAANVTFEGDTIVSFVMGASTITLTPASISIAGISIKLDGATAETAALILDN